MDGGILSTATEILANLWDWSGRQDGRLALLGGALVWFAVERVWGLLHAPFSKVIGVAGLLSVLGIAAAFLADGKGILRPDERIPFENSVKSPNADYFAGTRK